MGYFGYKNDEKSVDNLHLGCWVSKKNSDRLTVVKVTRGVTFIL